MVINSEFMEHSKYKKKKKFNDPFYENQSLKISSGYEAVGVSPYSRDVVLAGNCGLCVVDLQNPFDSPLIIPVNSQWKVVNVEWSPHKSHDSLVASTFNQSVLVYNLATGSKKPDICLSEDISSITGFNWSDFDPNLIITTWVDPFLRLWDIRTPVKPIYKFTDWEVASSVEFDKSSRHSFVSGRQNSVNIWDIRKGSRPLVSINNAHNSTIYSVSTSSKKRNTLITAASDKTIKVWDWSNAKNNYLTSTYYFDKPVSVARYIPDTDSFVATYKNSCGGLDIFSENQSGPIHRFAGHKKSVMEFVWSTRGNYYADSKHDFREWQLISIGSDHCLNKWHLPESVTEKISVRKGTPARVKKLSKINKDWMDQQPTFTKPYLGIILGPTAKTQTQLSGKKTTEHVLLNQNGVRMMDEIHGHKGYLITKTSDLYPQDTLKGYSRKLSHTMSIDKNSGLSRSHRKNYSGDSSPDCFNKPPKKASTGVILKWQQFNKTHKHYEKYVPVTFCINPNKIYGNQYLYKGGNATASEEYWDFSKIVHREIDKVLKARRNVSIIKLARNEDSLSFIGRTTGPWGEEGSSDMIFTFSMTFYKSYPAIPAHIVMVSDPKNHSTISKYNIRYINTTLSLIADFLAQKLYTQFDIILYFLQHGTVPRQFYSAINRLIVRNTTKSRKMSLLNRQKKVKFHGDSYYTKKTSKVTSSANDIVLHHPYTHKGRESLKVDRKTQSYKDGSLSNDTSSNISSDSFENFNYASDASSMYGYRSDYDYMSDLSFKSRRKNFVSSSAYTISDSSSDFGGETKSDRTTNPSKDYKGGSSVKSHHHQSGDFSVINALHMRSRGANNCPFPRLCGATFSGNNSLVVFFASLYTPATYPGEFELLLLNPALQVLQNEPEDAKTLGSTNKDTSEYNSMVAKLHRSNLSRQISLLPKPLVLQGIEYYRAMVQVKIQESSAKFVGIPVQYDKKKGSATLPKAYKNPYPGVESNSSGGFALRKHSDRHTNIENYSKNAYSSYKEKYRKGYISHNHSREWDTKQGVYKNLKQHKSGGRYTDYEASQSNYSNFDNRARNIIGDFIDDQRRYQKKEVSYDDSFLTPHTKYLEHNLVDAHSGSDSELYKTSIFRGGDRSDTVRRGSSLKSFSFRDSLDLGSHINRGSILGIEKENEGNDVMYPEDGFDEVPRFYFRGIAPSYKAPKTKLLSSGESDNVQAKVAGTNEIGSTAPQALSVGNLCLILDTRLWDQVVKMDITSIMSPSSRAQMQDLSGICMHNSKMAELSKQYLLSSAWYLLGALYKNIKLKKYSSILEYCNPVEKSFLLSVFVSYITSHDIENSVLLACALSSRFGVNKQAKYSKTEVGERGEKPRAFGVTGENFTENQSLVGTRTKSSRFNHFLRLKSKNGKAQELPHEKTTENRKNILDFEVAEVKKLREIFDTSIKSFEIIGTVEEQNAIPEVQLSGMGVSRTRERVSATTIATNNVEREKSDNKILMTLSRLLNRYTREVGNDDDTTIDVKSKYSKLQDLFTRQSILRNSEYQSEEVLNDLYVNTLGTSEMKLRRKKEREIHIRYMNNDRDNKKNDLFVHHSELDGVRGVNTAKSKKIQAEQFDAAGTSTIFRIPGLPNHELLVIYEYKKVYTKLLFADGHFQFANQICNIFYEDLSSDYTNPGIEYTPVRDEKLSLYTNLGLKGVQPKVEILPADNKFDSKDPGENSIKRGKRHSATDLKAVEHGMNNGERLGAEFEASKNYSKISSANLCLNQDLGGDTSLATVQGAKIRCFYCEKLVSGLALVCLKCNHGGHEAHVRAWAGWLKSNIKLFRISSSDTTDMLSEKESNKIAGNQAFTCPAGCGCKCIYNLNLPLVPSL